MPYETDQSDETTIKFAIGNQVSVNCLIGMSFIQSAKLVIDLEDNVVESKVLKTNPLKIEYLRPTKKLPRQMEHKKDANSSILYSDVNKSIDTCISFFLKDQKEADEKCHKTAYALEVLTNKFDIPKTAGK